MTLSTTERCILDAITEIKFTKEKKYKLIHDYTPVFMKNNEVEKAVEKIQFFVERIEFMEIVKDYARHRRRPRTVGSFNGRREMI